MNRPLNPSTIAKTSVDTATPGAPTQEIEDLDTAEVHASAQALLEAEGLPFPPLPEALAAQLTLQGPNCFATRPLPARPYDLDHYLDEAEAASELSDYALVGIDGHGSNSWALHLYLVSPVLALFIQRPWGGAYMAPEPARRDITQTWAWAAALQARLSLAASQGRIPAGWRLEIAVDQADNTGWRWLIRPAAPAQMSAQQPPLQQQPWNRAHGLHAAVLKELDELIAGRRVLAG